MSAGQSPEIIIFCYDISVFSRRIERYLDLRGLTYGRCIQPPNMPRPDLATLGIGYRRIPIMAIGRDVYMDTRIMIEKLEQLFPAGKLGSDNPFEQGLEKVFEGWVIDGGPFWRTAGCLPLSAPVLSDPVWMQDRSDITGGKFTRETLLNGRDECLAHLVLYFGIAEQMLADGRPYIMNTARPALGDVHLIWSFEWALNFQVDTEEANAGEESLNEKRFPLVCAWVARFQQASAEARQRDGGPGVVSSEEAIRHILQSDFVESQDVFETDDPLRLSRGQRVQVRPSDHGSTHFDEGEMFALSRREAVIASKVRDGEGVLRLHFPRNNFTIAAV